MVLLVICLVGLMTVYNYITLKNSFDQESLNLEIQSEQSIGAALRQTDTTTSVMDEQLNQQMLRGFTTFFAEYNRSGHDPAAMDLSRVKETLGEGYDVDVINESGVIVYSSYPSEIGLDFRNVPYFYNYLTKIRQSEGFFPDRVVHEMLGAGKYRKYAYEPTPDHRYVLEIGYSTPSFSEVNSKLDDEKNIADIVAVNPYIDTFHVYDVTGHRTDDASLPDNWTEDNLQRVIASRQTLESIDPADHTKVRYLFVDLKNPRYGSDLSRIVEIRYNTGRIQEALNNLVFIHLVFGSFAIFVGCIIAFFLSRRMTRPIAKIARDVDSIAGGDFDHRIGTTSAREFQTLEKGINTMVDSLKAATKSLKDDEIFQKDLVNQMPVGIFMKRTDTGRYVFWNRASEEIFERPADEVIGKTDEELFPGPMADRIKKEDREALGTRVELRYSKVTTKTKGERIIHMIIVPIPDSTKSVRYLLGIAEDVTEEATKLKRDLLFSITRSDILEQLAVIMTHLERAQLKATQDEMEIFFAKTLGSVEAIKNQIAYERGHQDPRTMISPVWQPVDRAFDKAVRMLPGQTSVDISCGTGPVEILADHLLPRIFLSLLSLSFRLGGPEFSMIRLGAHLQGDSLALVYEDNCRGIPVEEKEQIFECGYSRENTASLFLARELLSFTGITITETGEPGKGLRFVILVPKEHFRGL
jgi:PAS domain S-box-containing protein